MNSNHKATTDATIKKELWTYFEYDVVLNKKKLSVRYLI